LLVVVVVVAIHQMDHFVVRQLQQYWLVSYLVMVVMVLVEHGHDLGLIGAMVEAEGVEGEAEVEVEGELVVDADDDVVVVVVDDEIDESSNR
jgi:hypothetical protein